MPIHRHLKNVVKQYTESERKVREATSNDPWGPSSTLMAEIADMTHNVMAFTEIMQMIWKRLNDKNKNWRHVYKALVLLEYVIKTGSEKVATQCRENIHSIETLKDFQYVEEGKDYGMNVREKAKGLCNLLRDEEKLSEERGKGLKAKERLASGTHTMTGGSGVGGAGVSYLTSSSASPSIRPPYSMRSATMGAGGYRAPTTTVYGDDRMPPSSNYGHYGQGSGVTDGTMKVAASHKSDPDMESVRPQSEGEEQLQLQLALAMSKEEHDREMRRRMAEDAKEEAKLKMAMEQSRREEESTGAVTSTGAGGGKGGALFDLVDTSLSAAPADLPDPWSTHQEPSAQLLTTANGSNSCRLEVSLADPWGGGGASTAQPECETGANDPWGGLTGLGGAHPAEGGRKLSASSDSDTEPQLHLNDPTWSLEEALRGMSGDLIATGGVGAAYAVGSGEDELDDFISAGARQEKRRKSAADFLGEHKGLVNLDKLVVRNPASTNPFATSSRPLGAPQNPFVAQQPVKVPLNQLANQQQVGGSGAANFPPSNSGLAPTHNLPTPLISAPVGPVPAYPDQLYFPAMGGATGPQFVSLPPAHIAQHYPPATAARLNPFI